MQDSENLRPINLNLPGLAAGSVLIRSVANSNELLMVHRLTHECYVTEGYTTPQPNGRIDLYPGFDILDQTRVTVAI